MIKESISVYHPQDKLERALQNSYNLYNDMWLTSFECKSAASALSRLKRDGQWLYEDELFDVRAEHLFAPEMEGDGEEIVFPTYLLYLRDIIENEQISPVLHDPITFVSKPIAFYLLKEYPIHLIAKRKALKADFIKVGGLYTAEEAVEIPRDAIVGFKINDLLNKAEIDRSIKQILIEAKMVFNKAAFTNAGEGIFKLDYGIDLNIKANDRVQNKITKKKGIIYSTEPGDTGLVTVLFEDGDSVALSKEEFVKRFIYNLGKK